MCHGTRSRRSGVIHISKHSVLSTLSGVSIALDILCTSPVKRYYIKITIYCLHFTLVPAYRNSWKRKTRQQILWASVCLISYSKEIVHNN